MRTFLKLAAGGLILLVVIAVIISGGKKSRGTGTTSGTNTSTTTATTSAATAEVKRAHRNRCAHLTRSDVTSCPFALAVEKAYLSHPSGTVVAYSAVTHKTYTMHCIQSKGVAACTGGINSEVAFKSPAGPDTSVPVTSTTASTQPPAPTTQEVEQPGSSSHATDDQFCSAHRCIENFSNGNDSIVECQDGQWSHSGGLSGACSDHGGET